MRRAIELARLAEGFTHPNPMVGCVLVKDGHVVAEGFHAKPGDAHAEAMALAKAGKNAKGATAYVTLEPCNHFGRTPPCADGLIEAGVAEVIYGIRDLNKDAEGGADKLKAAGIAARLFTGDRDVTAACADLIRPWVHSLQCWRPWVTAKLAMTLDGFTATPTGESKWITGPEARLRGHDLRQRTDAILVGVGTILADDPSLDPRPSSRAAAASLKIILDSSLRTPVQSRVLSSPGSVLVVGHENADKNKAIKLETAGAEVLLLPGTDGQPDLAELLKILKDRSVVDLMIEGGGSVLGSAFDLGVVDEVWAFQAPILFSEGRAAISGTGPKQLADAFRLAAPTVERLGADTLIRGIRERRAPSCSQD